MKRYIKRGIAALGAVALVATLGACSSNSSDTASGGAFTYRMPTQFEQWLNDLKWLPATEKKSGVKVDLVDGGDSDNYYQKVDLAMSSGQIQDAMIASYAQAQVYGKQGAFQDLAPLIKQYAPNVEKYLDANPTYKNLVTNSDGH